MSQWVANAAFCGTAKPRRKSQPQGLARPFPPPDHPGYTQYHAQNGSRILADGVLEITAENHGFLRWPHYNFRPCPEDVYVPATLLKKYFLRAGNRIAGYLRAPRDKEKFMALDQVGTIEGHASESWTEPKHFDNLTPLFPTERIILENTARNSLSARAVDLICPAGKGPARPDRRSAADRKNHFTQRHCAGDPRQFTGEPCYSAVDRRAPGGSHRFTPQR